MTSVLTIDPAILAAFEETFCGIEFLSDQDTAHLIFAAGWRAALAERDQVRDATKMIEAVGGRGSVSQEESMTEPKIVTKARDLLRAYYQSEPLEAHTEALAEALAEGGPTTGVAAPMREAIRQALDAMASARSVIVDELRSLIDWGCDHWNESSDGDALNARVILHIRISAIDAAADWLVRAMQDATDPREMLRQRSINDDRISTEDFEHQYEAALRAVKATSLAEEDDLWTLDDTAYRRGELTQEADPVAFRATSITGETAHFGVASAARAWARGGTVEAVPLKHLRLVPKHSECGPDCRQCGMLCKQGADIDQRFAGRLAVALECMTFDPMGFWESSTRLLSEYKAEWEKVNPHPATFMGEPIAGNRERLLKAKADRAKISQKSRADYSDCHGPNWTDRDGECLK